VTSHEGPPELHVPRPAEAAAAEAADEMTMARGRHMFDLPPDWAVDDVSAFYRTEIAAVVPSVRRSR